jgi:hypothetical protein
MIIDPANLLGQELNPIAIPLFSEFLDKIQTELFCDVRINCVYDSYQQGVELNKQDARNPIFSFHTFGIAIDLDVIKDDRTYFKHDSLKDWQSTGVPTLATKLGIRWGGVFQGYQDCVHFDLAAKFGDNVYDNLNEMIALAKAQFGNDLTNTQLNKTDLTKCKNYKA